MRLLICGYTEDFVVHHANKNNQIEMQEKLEMKRVLMTEMGIYSKSNISVRLKEDILLFFFKWWKNRRKVSKEVDNTTSGRLTSKI